jgi:ubiquinone/menaquinone biosynthesis C-methylase UbiE
MSQAGKSQKLSDAQSRDDITWIREQVYSALTQQMLEAAQLKPGDQVLDIAAGTGAQSRMAAKLVGPNGSVLATDISEEALLTAAQLAEQDGYRNITTRVANAEQLDLADDTYDAAISRFGLMLISNQQQALAEIRRVLKPGGRLAAIVWSLADHNPLFAIYIDVIEQPVEGHETKRFGVFSLADAAHFAAVLQGVGFQQVQVQTIPITFRFPSFDMLRVYWGPLFEEMLARLGSQKAQAVLEHLQQAARRFEGPEGIVAPGEVLLGVGVK